MVLFSTEIESQNDKSSNIANLFRPLRHSRKKPEYNDDGYHFSAKMTLVHARVVLSIF